MPRLRIELVVVRPISHQHLPKHPNEVRVRRCYYRIEGFFATACIQSKRPVILRA